MKIISVLILIFILEYAICLICNNSFKGKGFRDGSLNENDCKSVFKWDKKCKWYFNPWGLQHNCCCRRLELTVSEDKERMLNNLTYIKSYFSDDDKSKKVSQIRINTITGENSKKIKLV